MDPHSRLLSQIEKLILTQFAMFFKNNPRPLSFKIDIDIKSSELLLQSGERQTRISIPPFPNPLNLLLREIPIRMQVQELAEHFVQLSHQWDTFNREALLVSEYSNEDVISHISTILLEDSDPATTAQIAGIVFHHNAESALDVLQDALDIYAQGGMDSINGKKYRTIGGIFFYLIKRQYGERDKEIPTWARIKGINAQFPEDDLDVSQLRAYMVLNGYLTKLPQKVPGSGIWVGKINCIPSTEDLPRELPNRPHSRQTCLLCFGNRHYRKLEEAHATSKPTKVSVRGIPYASYQGNIILYVFSLLLPINKDSPS